MIIRTCARDSLGVNPFGQSTKVCQRTNPNLWINPFFVINGNRIIRKINEKPFNVKIFSFQPNPTCLKLAVVLPKEVKGIAYLFLRQKG